MGLAWQQAPHGPNPAGRFLLKTAIPDHVLYAEPAGRRMRVELAGVAVATSDDVVLLHETGQYPVAYFPARHIRGDRLVESGKRTTHAELGEATWWTLQVAGRSFANVAWSYQHPPEHAREMAGLVAFVWAELDAVYEEQERIFGHAADPYHRVDVRASDRHVSVHLNGRVIADTRAPLALFETGFAPRWYLPLRDCDAAALGDDPLRTLCPYKGVAQYFDVIAGGVVAAGAAWCYPEALPESARLRGYVSFDPGQLELRVDDVRLQPVAHQEVFASGDDRDLTAG
jgi:uncharacterized protein (DUF427 family)